MARKSKKIKSSKALVKYDNKFNESSLSSLNPIEIKLLHAIISQIKDQGTSEVVIPFENLKALISDNTGRTYGEIVGLLDNSVIPIMKSSIFRTVDENGVIRTTAMVSSTEIDPNRKTFKVQVHEDASYMFNDIAREFTSFPMADFSQLKHAYSLILYRQLMQWKSVGIYTISIEDLKDIMLDEAHRKSYEEFKIFNRDYIKKAVKEINEKFPDMNLTVEYTRQGRQTTSVTFKFNKFKVNKVVDVDFKNAELNSGDEIKGYIALALNRQPNKSENTMINGWIEKNISEDMVKACFEYAADKASVRYCNAVLLAWNEKGYTKPSDVPELVESGIAFDGEDALQQSFFEIVPVYKE